MIGEMKRVTNGIKTWLIGMKVIRKMIEKTKPTSYSSDEDGSMSLTLRLAAFNLVTAVTFPAAAVVMQTLY